MAALTIAQLDAMGSEEAVAAIGGVFEQSPWIVERTWSRRPFRTREALHRALVETVQASGAEAQLALIRAHPDLVGEAARRGSLTRESTAEQRSAGLSADDLSEEEVEKFVRLNAAYQERFGFPFVICAREHRKASILAGFEARLGNSADEERATALAEIARIAWYRLADGVQDNASEGDPR